MVSRGMLEDPYLAAVLAHEFSHLATLDGRLTAAISRIVLWKPPEYRRRAPLRWLAALARGGTSLRLLRPLWGAWWREREYQADAYAARLGRADELATFLETHALLYDRPVPFMWLTEHTHPPTELRIERLQRDAQPVA